MRKFIRQTRRTGPVQPFQRTLFGCLAGILLTLFSAGVSASAIETSPEAVDDSTGTTVEKEEENEVEKKEEASRYRFLPIPIFITEPAVGNGLGVALTLFHPVKSGKNEGPPLASLDSVGDITNAREAPPVVTAVGGAYTNNRTWAVAVGHYNNWRNDSIRYMGAVAAARVNSEIYILGLPLGFEMETSIVYQDLKFRVGSSDFMLGFGLSYLDATAGFDLNPPENVEPSLFDQDFKNVGLSFKASWETRNNQMNPTQGQLIDLSLWRYDDAIGGDFDYWNAKLKALSFHSLSEKFTLGLRAEVSGVDGNAPFFAVPFVKLRGIPALRYQNKVAGAVEAELRWRFAERWDAAVFGGLGYTSDDIPIFENPDDIYNFGVGARFNIFQAHNVWVGIDIARGPEDTNWYIQVGHPW